MTPGLSVGRVLPHPAMLGTGRASMLAPATPTRRSKALRRFRSHILAENLFAGVLTRELRRAERLNQSVGVMVLSASDNFAADQTLTASVLDALAAATRETDVVGWLEEGQTLGIVLTETPALAPESAASLQSRVKRELRKRLSPNIDPAPSFHLKMHAMSASSAIDQDAASAPVFTIPQPGTPSAIAYDSVKRALDILGSLGLLILLSPLFLAIALLVKWNSPGPVLFRQQRIGQWARPFTILKFRTMFVDANDAMHQQYVNWFITSSTQDGRKASPVFKITNDPRVTLIGRLLRKTSFDELPQLWNVLRGEMSLVGPRPPLPYEVAKYKRWHRRRVLEAKPGITGLWQVAGRSRTTFDEMVRLDLRYAKTYSFWTDIRILLATPKAVISGKGAC
jgi:lipopolysaccharide/colanic/teichoic acid biosynthesis glycosyltransferase